jgi:hypothetical protein
MLAHMGSWSPRDGLVTVIVVLGFTLGCAGTSEGYPEPNTAEAAAYHDGTGPRPGLTTVGEEPADAEPVDAENVGYYEDTDPSALTAFRDELAPYGAWVDDPVYGTVWVPSAEVVGADFAPYVTAGHWALTERGEWLWVSDYSWGWAPFHYGRWVWIPARGWGWIPGRRYAPAWVVWRVGEPGYAYVGWAPMPPYYYWSAGVAVGLWVIPPAPYVFCHSHHVFAPHVHHHVVGGGHVASVAARTHPHQPATPSVGGASGHRFARPARGPSLEEAQVPAGSAPREYARPEPKAAAAAARPAPAGGGAYRAPSGPGGAGAPSRGGLAGAGVRPQHSGAPRAALGAPVYRGRTAPGGLSAGAVPHAGSWATGPTPAPAPGAYRGPVAPPAATPPAAYRMPSTMPAYNRAPSYSAPSWGTAYRSPGAAPMPSYGSRTAPPSFHAPSVGPSYRSPSMAPSYRPMSPSPAYRPPSASPGFVPAARPSTGHPMPARRGR